MLELLLLAAQIQPIRLPPVWPTISMPTIPGTKAPCPAPNYCVAESNEANNNYAVAGVRRGTPDRLNAPEAPPATVMVPERG